MMSTIKARSPASELREASPWRKKSSWLSTAGSSLVLRVLGGLADTVARWSRSEETNSFLRARESKGEVWSISNIWMIKEMNLSSEEVSGASERVWEEAKTCRVLSTLVTSSKWVNLNVRSTCWRMMRKWGSLAKFLVKAHSTCTDRFFKEACLGECVSASSR